jgi:hypothetical protein
MKHIFVLLACGIAVTSCSTLVTGGPQPYESSEIPGPKADLTLISNQKGASSSHSYELIGDSSCQDRSKNKLLAQFSWATKREKTIQIPAGNEFTIASFQAQATSRANGYRSYAIGMSRTCMAAVKFIPQADEGYIVSQPATCDLIIQNAVTKLPVKTEKVSLAACLPASTK